MINREVIQNINKHTEDIKNLGSSLEENATEVSILKEQVPLKASAESVKSLETVKADKVYVDNITQSLASGSPRGVYPTLSALQTAFPTGNANIYLVSADGGWYYWNGSSWTKGGIYQSTAIPDNAVTESKLNVIYRQGKLISGGLNFNFTTDILEIATGTNISDYNGFYGVANTSNIAMSSDAYPRYVFFNTTTKLLHVEARWFAPNPKELLICCYYNKKLYYVNNTDLITLNGKEIYEPKNRDAETLITDATINFTKLKFTYCHAALISGNINIDTINKKLTISNDISISDYTGFYSVTNTGDVSYNIDTTYPCYLYFNKTTNTIHLELRWFSYSQSELLLGVLYNNKLYNTLSSSYITINGANQNAISNWKGVKWVSYGDSITANGGWQTIVSNILGLSHTKMGIVSSTIVNDSTWATPMCDDARLNSIPGDTQLITIMGGTNDWAGRKNIGTINDIGKDTYYGAYKYIIETIQTRLPNCRIVLIAPPFGYYNAGLGDGIFNNVGKTTKDFGDVVIELGRFYGLPVLDMRGKQGINKFNKDIFLVSEDVQVHMTDKGNTRFAGLVIGALESINNF